MPTIHGIGGQKVEKSQVQVGPYETAQEVIRVDVWLDPELGFRKFAEDDDGAHESDRDIQQRTSKSNAYIALPGRLAARRCGLRIFEQGDAADGQQNDGLGVQALALGDKRVTTFVHHA